MPELWYPTPSYAWPPAGKATRGFTYDFPPSSISGSGGTVPLKKVTVCTGQCRSNSQCTVSPTATASVCGKNPLLTTELSLSAPPAATVQVIPPPPCAGTAGRPTTNAAAIIRIPTPILLISLPSARVRYAVLSTGAPTKLPHSV